MQGDGQGGCRRDIASDCRSAVHYGIVPSNRINGGRCYSHPLRMAFD
jgi:hypothetical protein